MYIHVYLYMNVSSYIRDVCQKDISESGSHNKDI